MLMAIEKYILESIQKGNKSLFEIHKDTELEPRQITALLNSLVIKGLLGKDDNGSYYQISDKSSIKKKYKMIEIAQIIKNNIKNSFKGQSSQFKMRKVYLNSQEEKIFNSMLINLEDFLNGITCKKGQTSKEKLIFWGENSYQNIINDLCGI